MAYLYIRTSLIKASNGKSAVASAAYMSAQALYNERLGMTFQYRHKEEVVHSEILLPFSADEALRDRETLWNTVEAYEKKRSNARLGRQYIMALPNTWSDELAIQLCREFLQKELVDLGFVVDWALHNKENNTHIHVMVTPRKIKDGKWQNNKKSIYAVDEEGNKIPELNEDGTQKQRTRTRTVNGTEYTTVENLWKRISIDHNELNSRAFLWNLKKSWVQLCNQHLSQEEQIDGRSFRESDSNRVPLLHEGSGCRAALERGIVFDVIKENRERRMINAAIERIEKLIQEARRLLEVLKQKFEKWRQHEKDRSRTAVAAAGRDGTDIGRIHISDARNDDGAGEVRSITEIIKNATELTQRTEKVRKHRHRR